MLTLHITAVPSYLHSSKLYQAFIEHGHTEITVPLCKADLSLESDSDLSHLLETLMIWTSDECFEEIVDYVFNKISAAGLEIVCNLLCFKLGHFRYIELLKYLRENRGVNPLNRALYHGYLVVAAFMVKSGFELDGQTATCAFDSMNVECVRFVSQAMQMSRLGLSTFKKSHVQGKYYILIRPSDVPNYLHTSALYQSLDLASNDAFQVPIVHYKQDLAIESTVDLVLLLDTLDYWGSDEIFTEPLHFMYHMLTRSNVESVFVFQHCGQKMKYVHTIISIASQYEIDGRMSMALQSGNVRLVSFLREQGLQLDDMSIQYAIRSQNPDCIRYVLENKESILPTVIEDELYYPKRNPFESAQPNDICTLKYCIDNKLTDVLTVECCMIAAKAGDLEVLQQLHELRCPWDVTCCTEAAAQGHLHCLTYAHEQGAPWDAGTCAAAAKNKHIECLTYLIENSCPADGAVSRAAIANCDLEMLIFAHENLLPWEDDMCMLAAHAGSLPCLKYLHEAGCDLTSETCAAAATRYDYECLRCAHDNGAPWTVSTTIAAAKIGELTRFKYVHQNGCPIDKQVCMTAIKAGCARDMLRYMGENNFPFDANHCRVAAKEGLYYHLSLLHIYGCPWTAATTRDAAAKGRLKELKYAAERGCPVQPITCSYGVDVHEDSSHVTCMKYIFDNHDSTFDSISAITRDHFACFCYAHDNGTPWSEAIFVTAARLGKLNYLTYAFESYPFAYYKYFPSVYSAALTNEHPDCIEFLENLHQIMIRKLPYILRCTRRSQRKNGRMSIRRVFIRNWFARQDITSHRRLSSKRRFANVFTPNNSQKDFPAEYIKTTMTYFNVK